MTSVSFSGKIFEIDDQGFLVESGFWERAFAIGMADQVGITGGLTDKHWEIINFIREVYLRTGTCPLVFQTCKAAGLRLAEFKALFPFGYLRGACRLAGVTYREGYLGVEPYSGLPGKITKTTLEKTYEIDILGFLVKPENWDEEYAVSKAREMKMPEGLTEWHWQIIRYLRKRFQKEGKVPTFFETCEANQLEIEDFEKLFPDGYHRGAVKLAGLRVR